MSGIGNGGPDDSAETHIVTHTLTSEGPDASEDGSGRGVPLVAAPLTSGGHPNSNAPGRRKEDDENLVAFLPTGGGAKGLSATDNLAPGPGTGGTVAVAFALRRDPGGIGQSHNTNFIADTGVRRLTPIECERLQGLPDDWTAPDELGGPGVYAQRPNGDWACSSGIADSARYSGLGDAVTANVAEWIGRRIAAVDEREQAAA